MTVKLMSLVTSVLTIVATSSATARMIDDREMRQEARIDQREAAGQLTRSQAQQLMSAEKHLLRVEARMRWQYGGDLSQVQRDALQRLADQDRAAITRMARGSVNTAARHQ